MNINATILVQAFNFFIVYWMLRLLLFKPIIAIIDHEKNRENALHDIINQQKKSLEIQEKERQHQWYICQEYFATHQPPILQQKPSLDEIDQDSEVVETVSADSIISTISQAKSALEEKIKHVY